MKSLIAVLVFLATVATGCGGAPAMPLKASAPPLPVVRYTNTLPGQTVTTTVDLVQNVLTFAPGAASTLHVHTTPNLATVLQGQVTVKTPEGDKLGTLGTGLVEPLNEPVQATNPGAGDTMVGVAFAVPHGGKPTRAVTGQPPPAIVNKTLYSYTLDSPAVTGGYSIVQQLVEFGDGAATPKQRVGGPGVVTVISGQLSVVSDGQQTVYSAGQSLSELPDQTLQLSNAGTYSALVIASYLLPDGARLTTKL